MDSAGIEKVHCSTYYFSWIWLDDKSWGGCSFIWKGVIYYFELIGSGMVWRAGNGRLVRVGLDPSVGFSGAHALSMNLRLILSGSSIFFLSNMADLGTSTLWH